MYPITFSGAILSIVAYLAAQLCPDMKKLGAYMGTTFLAMSPGILITLPISGALVVDTNSAMSPYLPMKLFCGFAICVGGAFFIISRAFHIRARRAGRPESDVEIPHVRIILS